MKGLKKGHSFIHPKFTECQLLIRHGGTESIAALIYMSCRKEKISKQMNHIISDSEKCYKTKQRGMTMGMSMRAQLCLILCVPMGCSRPGSSVHGILQERILEWVAISFSRKSSQPRD